MQSVALRSLSLNVMKISLAEKLVLEDAVGIIEVENSKLIASYRNIL